MRRRAHVVGAAMGAMLLLLELTGPAMAVRPVDGWSSSPASTCVGRGFTAQPDDDARVDELLDGRLRLLEQPVVDLPEDPTWAEDPLGDANWRFQYHALEWLDVLRRSERPEAHARLGVLLEDWWRDNADSVAPTTSDDEPTDFRWFDMAVGRRVLVLDCARSVIGEPGWLLDALRVHGEVLRDDAHYAGHGNHALHQDVGLFVAGCLLGETAWTEHALARSTRLLAREVDAQGVSREGSASYQLANHDWWSDAADRIRACEPDRWLPTTWRRIPRMASVMAHFIGPDARWVMLGDTLPDAVAAPPGTAAAVVASGGRDRSSADVPPRIAVLGAGYAFARSSWDTSPRSTAFSVAHQFGPPMTDRVHGHEDHGNIVVQKGRHRLVDDAGLHAYFGGPDRQHAVSNAAHNVVLVDGARYYRSAEAPLVGQLVQDDLLVTSVQVKALEQARWTRTVAVVPSLDLVVVDDRVGQDLDRVVRQRWHLARDAEPVVAPDGRSLTVAGPGALSLTWLGDDPALELGTGRRSVSYGTSFDVPMVDATARGPARFTTVVDASGEDRDVELVWRSSTALRLRLLDAGGDGVDLTVDGDEVASSCRRDVADGVAGECRPLEVDWTRSWRPTRAARGRRR